MSLTWRHRIRDKIDTVTAEAYNPKSFIIPIANYNCPVYDKLLRYDLQIEPAFVTEEKDRHYCKYACEINVLGLLTPSRCISPFQRLKNAARVICSQAVHGRCWMAPCGAIATPFSRAKKAGECQQG
jgi:hypothetical protein